MTIAFNYIDTSKLNAGVFVEAVKGPKTGAYKQSKRTLIIGTATAASTGPKLAVTRVYDPDDGHKNWGYGTPIGAEVEESLATNPGTELYIIASSDTAGTAHTKTITLTVGPASAAGIIKGKLNGVSWSASFASGSTITQVAAAGVAAIQALTKLPMSAANSAGVITLTAKWKGASGNDIVLSDVSVADSSGASVGITVAVANAVSGATNPDQTSAMGVLQETDVTFTEFVTEYGNDSTAMGLIETELNRRALPEVARRGILYVAVPGSQGTVTTWVGSRTNGHVCAIAYGTGPTAPWVIAAHVAALRSKANDPLKTSLGSVLPSRIPTCTRAQAISSVAREALAALKVSSLVLDESGKFVVELLRMCDGESVYTHEMLGAIEFDLRFSLYEQLIASGKRLVSDSKDPQSDGEISPAGIKNVLATRINGPLRNFFTDPAAVIDALVVEQNADNPNAVDVSFTSSLVKFINRMHVKAIYT